MLDYCNHCLETTPHIELIAGPFVSECLECGEGKGLADILPESLESESVFGV